MKLQLGTLPAAIADDGYAFTVEFADGVAEIGVDLVRGAAATDRDSETVSVAAVLPLFGGAAETGSMAEFGALVAAARKAQRWTQDDVAERTGISRATLSRWERGKADQPTGHQARKLCLALGVNPVRAVVALGFLTAEEATLIGGVA